MNPPAGWHPDPYFDPRIERYWDGQQWTEQTRPIGSDDPTTMFDAVARPGNPAPPSASKRRRWPWIAGAAAVGVFGVAALTGGTSDEQGPVTTAVTTTSEATPTTTAPRTTTTSRTTTPAPTTTSLAPDSTTTVPALAPAAPRTTTTASPYVPPEPAYTPPATTERAPAYTPPPEPAYTAPPAYTPPPVADTPSSVYYKNCTAARNAGAAPVRIGQPGYGTHLDRDGDGVGCE
ncbi:excalibur calcium-binding domain-containing protein [Rhodococcus artemisiae]|uniref:Excalibur calcium-binding domain-containing protein n=1 Tax=Rhodococcus artemisiae TaxID=714159 RepID=A0ABU7L7T6_9NOCA|nr:excalibur calcium-binding domain-containing protein [Rhodococcus artemisiae]MEE2057609.1 excalibur calcium-binding domain-containing protein [Rhodococcus artemisiae]